jgi:hypothetical protein
VARDPKTRPATRQDARTRLQSAQAYLQVAELALGDRDGAMPGVAAGVAVLAGIAASDAICASRLGLIHRSDNHRAAADLLAQSTTDGKRLALTLGKLIEIKDTAHYGLSVVEPARARHAVGWARKLVDRAQDELER